MNDSLPIDQIGKRQARAAEWLIKPDTKVMQGDFSGQTGPEAAEVMRPLSIQAEPVMETAIDRLSEVLSTIGKRDFIKIGGSFFTAANYS